MIEFRKLLGCFLSKPQGYDELCKLQEGRWEQSICCYWQILYQLLYFGYVTYSAVQIVTVQTIVFDARLNSKDIKHVLVVHKFFSPFQHDNKHPRRPQMASGFIPLFWGILFKQFSSNGNQATLTASIQMSSTHYDTLMSIVIDVLSAPATRFPYPSLWQTLITDFIGFYVLNLHHFKKFNGLLWLIPLCINTMVVEHLLCWNQTSTNQVPLNQSVLNVSIGSEPKLRQVKIALVFVFFFTYSVHFS